MITKIKDIGMMNKQLNIVYEHRDDDGQGGKKDVEPITFRSNVWCNVKPWKCVHRRRRAGGEVDDLLQQLLRHGVLSEAADAPPLPHRLFEVHAVSRPCGS